MDFNKDFRDYKEEVRSNFKDNFYTIGMIVFSIALGYIIRMGHELLIKYGTWPF